MTGITFRNVKVEISVDGGANWTNISGQTNSVTVGGGDREIGMIYDAASDFPTLGAGKRAELELTVRVKYTETDAEAQGVLASAYEDQTEVFVRYSPIGEYEYTFATGYVKTNPYPGQEVESGDPLRLEFTIIINPQTRTSSVTSLFGSALIAYWPLNETAGTVAKDQSGNGRNGAYSASGVTLSNATSITGDRSPLFNVGDVNVYSASLASAFSGAEGGVFGTVKMSAGSVWTDATARYLVLLQADASNRVYLRKDTGNNALLALYSAGGTSKSNAVYLENSSWFSYAITWSKSADTVDFYINGAKITTLTGLGIWAGSLGATTTRIGSIAAGTSTHAGWQGDIGVVNRKITASEAEALSTGHIRAKRLAILGDSTSSIQSTPLKWGYQLGNLGYHSNYLGIMNHAVSGHSIISQMDTQTTAAASDDADVIIIALGTNDDNAGNMTTLQAEIEENIAELQASNADSTIYYLNVLPRWTDGTGATPVDKGNIRTAIAAACTAQGVTCWDTYTDPWITAAQTSDGLHPTAAGHAAIAAKVVARL